MVPKLALDQQDVAKTYEQVHLPKGSLDASDVILAPVTLGNFLLTNWYTTPSDLHDSDIVDIVLIKDDFETREVTLGPLV